jgi:eukaryotic-like serine/threonine-protein kinase
VLYELLTAKLPFQSTSLLELCALVLETRPAPMTASRDDVPPMLDLVVSKCLDKNRETRFSDVSRLVAALEPFVGPEAAGASARTSAILARAVSKPPVSPRAETKSELSPFASTVAVPDSIESKADSPLPSERAGTVSWHAPEQTPETPEARPSRRGRTIVVAIVAVALIAIGVRVFTGARAPDPAPQSVVSSPVGAPSQTAPVLAVTAPTDVATVSSPASAGAPRPRLAPPVPSAIAKPIAPAPTVSNTRATGAAGRLPTERR